MTPATPEQIREITKNVLARPEFLERPSLTQLLIDRVLQWLDKLVRWSATNPDLAKVLIVALGILLLLLVVHIVYTVVSEFVSLRKPRDPASAPQPMRALEGVAESWSDAFRIARNALAAGDLYKGLWVTHRVLLSVLDRMDRVKFVRNKTNTDYLRECRGGGDPALILSEVTTAYERVVYAHNDFDGLQAIRLLDAVEILAAGAGR